MTWKIREYEDGDETGILDLLKASYGLTDYMEFWRWMVKTNPSGHAKIYLAHDDNKFVGHYMVVPRRRKIRDKIIMDGEAVYAMVHPEYRKQGIFTELGRFTLDAIKNEIPICTGFPNKYAIKGHIKTGWHFFDVPLLKLPLTKKSNVKDKTAFHGEKFGKKFDDFWDKTSKNYVNIVVRDSAYLNYRYYYKPIDYEVRVVEDKEILGFVVLKKYFDKSHIVDILAVDEEVLSCLIDASINFAINNKSEVLSCIMVKDRLYYKMLLSKGFNDLERTQFIYHLNDESFKMPKEFFITMGDWAVF